VTLQRQQSPQILTPGEPLIRIGKVLAVQRHAHTVDLIFLNGLVVRAVPVASGWGGSAFGFTGLMAPYRDSETLSRKTYPEAPNPVQTTRPAANTEVPRDIYAVVASIDGSSRGDSGHVVIGFLYPQVSEMMFSADQVDGEGRKLFQDFLLVRHPSDLEVMVDEWGGLRAQHPTLAILAMLNAPPFVPGSTGRLDLTKQDYDQLYEIRANTARMLPVNGREPMIEVRIPKWFIVSWEIEALGSGLVTLYPPDGPPEEQAPPTRGAFGCTMSAPIDNGGGAPGSRVFAVVATYRGEKARVLRADGRLCEVSPPFSIAPNVGESVSFERIPIEHCGWIFSHYQNTGDLRTEAFWREPLPDGMTVIRGAMNERAGVLHDTLVEAGDILETAHPSEETGGNIQNRADINHHITAGMASRVENDAGAKLILLPDGTIKMLSPGDIWITAKGILHLDGALILENMGGTADGGEGVVGAGAESEAGENGGTFPSDGSDNGQEGGSDLFPI
jgi:hypothetical protein